MILAALDNPRVNGPLNIVGPKPVTNREMARAFAQILRRPAILPVPRPALRLLLGQASVLRPSRPGAGTTRVSTRRKGQLDVGEHGAQGL